LTTLEGNNIFIFDTVRDFHTERKHDSFLSTREICAGSWSFNHGCLSWSRSPSFCQYF